MIIRWLANACPHQMSVTALATEFVDHVGAVQLHPDWFKALQELKAESLMSRARFDEISNARWERILADRQRRGRWRYWQDPAKLARIP